MTHNELAALIAGSILVFGGGLVAVRKRDDLGIGLVTIFAPYLLREAIHVINNVT